MFASGLLHGFSLRTRLQLLPLGDDTGHRSNAPV